MNSGTNRRARTPSAVFSAIMAAVLSIGLSGCSLLFIHEPPENQEASKGPECSSPLWPVVDIVWAAAHVVWVVNAIAMAHSGITCGEGGSGSDGCWIGYASAVPFVGMAAIHGFSSGVGFSRNSKCREARQAAVEKVKIGLGEDRYTAPKIKPPEIILKSKEPVAAEKDHEKKPEDLTVPMKFELPMIEKWRQPLEERLLEDEIKQIKELQNVAEGPVKADLLFRLAERYLEKALTQYEKEMKEYDKKLKKWEEEKNRDPNVPKPVVNHRGSKVWLKAAVDVFRVILRNFKDYKRCDAVLFLAAYGLMKSGERQEGVDTYRQLIEEHPKSPFVTDSYLALGEHFFDAGDYESAKKEYEKSATYEGNEASYLARYKLAWCYLKLGNQPLAKAIMRTVAAESKSEKLRSRANRELKVTFAE